MRTGWTLFPFLILFVGCDPPSGSNRASQSPRSVLLGSHFREINRVGDLPAGVLAAFSAIPPDAVDTPGLADPDGPWQGSCIVDGDGPPTRRLIFGGCSDQACFLYFEHGGLGVDVHFITFALDRKGGASPLESLVFPERLKTVADVRLLANKALTRAQANKHEPW